MLPLFRLIPVGGVFLAIAILLLALNPPRGTSPSARATLMPAHGALIDRGEHPEWRQFLIQAALRRAGEVERLRDLHDTVIIRTEAAPAQPVAPVVVATLAPVTPEAEATKPAVIEPEAAAPASIAAEPVAAAPAPTEPAAEPKPVAVEPKLAEPAPVAVAPQVSAPTPEAPKVVEAAPAKPETVEAAPVTPERDAPAQVAAMPEAAKPPAPPSTPSPAPVAEAPPPETSTPETTRVAAPAPPETNGSRTASDITPVATAPAVKPPEAKPPVAIHLAALAAQPVRQSDDITGSIERADGGTTIPVGIGEASSTELQVTLPRERPPVLRRLDIRRARGELEQNPKDAPRQRHRPHRARSAKATPAPPALPIEFNLFALLFKTLEADASAGPIKPTIPYQPGKGWNGQ